MALVLDTGPLYASLDRSDAAHDASTRLLQESDEELVIPAPVLVEVEQLARARLPDFAFGSLLGDISVGAYVIESLDLADYARIGRSAGATWTHRLGLSTLL